MAHDYGCPSPPPLRFPPIATSPPPVRVRAPTQPVRVSKFTPHPLKLAMLLFTLLWAAVLMLGVLYWLWLIVSGETDATTVGLVLTVVGPWFWIDVTIPYVTLMTILVVIYQTFKR